MLHNVVTKFFTMKHRKIYNKLVARVRRLRSANTCFDLARDGSEARIIKVLLKINPSVEDLCQALNTK